MGIGFSEIIVIILVAIVLIRPEDLPAVFRQIGRIWGQFQKISRDFERSVRDFSKTE